MLLIHWSQIGQTQVLVPERPESGQQTHLVDALIPGSELQLDKARNKTRLDSASKGFEITGFDLL